jgi:hypothetical protein
VPAQAPSALGRLAPAAANIIDGMHKTGARRLIAISAAAAFIPEDPDKSWIAKQIQPRIFAGTFADVRQMERVVKDSDLDWTLVRPTRLVNDPGKGEYRVRAAARSPALTWRTSSAPRSPRPATSASARPSPTDSRHRPGSAGGAPGSRARAWRSIRGSTPWRWWRAGAARRGARAAEGQLPAPAVIAASSLALAGRELGRRSTAACRRCRPCRRRAAPAACPPLDRHMAEVGVRRAQVGHARDVVHAVPVEELCHDGGCGFGGARTLGQLGPVSLPAQAIAIWS